MYINDFNLQDKIKNIIINELNNKETGKIKKKKSIKYQFRHSTTHSPDFLQISNKNNDNPKISDTVIQKPYNELNSFKHSNSLKKLGSKNLLDFLKKKTKISKEKLAKVKKKLSVITKNIQNTNKAINNPNEFYMNFFNDIIQKETLDIQNDEDKDEKKEQNFSDNSL